MTNYYLHDGLVFYNYKDYREHFESCPKCKPVFDEEKRFGRELAKLFAEKIGRALFSSVIATNKQK